MRIIGNDPNTPRQTQVVASGTLSTGDTIVVNADGTVSAVSETSISEAVGTAVTYDTGAAGENEVVYDSNAQKVVVTYRDTSDSNKGHAVVGTVNASNNSISFGTPVQFTSRNIEYSDATYDPVNNKVVIAYADSGAPRYGFAIVGDVSGTSISFGSETVFNAYEVQHVAIGYAGDGKVVIVYEDWGNSNYGMAIVGTISGTSISFGTEVVCESARIGYPSVVYDSGTGKVVVGLSTYANSEHGYAKVGTVSGTSISFGSSTVFQSSVIQDLAGAYDSSAQKVVFVYRDAGNSFYGTAVAGGVSGTSISFGSSVVFNSANTNKPNIAFDANVEKICIAYRDNGNSSYGTARSGTVSGTSITFDPEFVINAANSNQWGAGYDASAKKVVFAFYDSSSTDGEAVVYQASGSSQNLTAENYIGTAKSGAADGDGVVVNTQGTVSDIPVSNYAISSASYEGKSFDVSSQDTLSLGLAFSADGTKMYMCGANADAIFQYSLSTAWDVSTASYDSISLSVSSQDTVPRGILLNADGTSIYVCGDINAAIFQYDMTTAYDLSTASYASKSLSVSSEEPGPAGIAFNNNGTKIYVIGYNNDNVRQYALSTAYDVSTGSYESKTLDVSSQDSSPRSLFFNSDGTKLFVNGNATDTMYQYSLSSAYDVSTGSYDSVSFNYSSEADDANAVTVKPDGSKIYVCNFGSGQVVYQYSTVGSLTAGQSYYVQTDGTLSTTAGDPSVFAGTAVSATKLIVKG